MSEDGASTMVMKKSGEAAVGICLVLCLVVVCPTRAEEFGGVKDGFYLGAMFAYNGMSGEFDDSFYLVSDSDSDEFDVPDLDNGAGFGLVLGRRFDKISFEVGYQRTTHDTSSSIPAIGDSDTAYNVADMNIKIDMFARNKLRPYVLLGGGIPWLTIEDSMSDDGGATWDKDVKYVGFCLNAGVGVAYYFDPQWAVMGGLIHRWNWFTHVENSRIDEDVSERALGLTLGIAYTF